MAISTDKLLKLTQFQTGLEAAKTYVDGKVTTINTALDGKAAKATTLAGYGIADAYTKTEVDGKLSSVFTYKGTVASFAELPTDAKVGDTYNITSADPANGVKAGDNAAWSGTAWDILAGTVDLSGYYTKDEVDDAIAEAAASAGIKLSDLSATVSGTGNAVTGVTYDNTTGVFTVQKGLTFLQESDITINTATDAEVTAVCNAVFGA